MSKSAIIIIDMQNEFCIEKCSVNQFKVRDNIVSIVKNLNKLLVSARNNNWEVIWLNWGVDSNLSEIDTNQLNAFNSFQYPESMSFKKKLNRGKKVLEKGSWSAKVISGLEKHKDDILIYKKRVSGFWFSDLDAVLKKNKIQKLYFTGINTDQCVQATLVDAHCLGYETHLIKDCTSTTSPDFCYEATLYNVKNLYGNVVYSTEVIFTS